MAEEIYPPDPRRASGDLILEADYDRDGFGRFSINTGGVERLAIEADGTPSGIFAPRAAYPKRGWLPENYGATMLQTFQAGHGWTVFSNATGGGAGANLNYTTIPGPFSDRCIQMVNGVTGVEEVQGAQTLDMTGKTLLVWLRYPGTVAASNPVVRVLLSDTAITNYYTGLTNPYSAAEVAPSNDEWVCHEFFLPEMSQTGAPTPGGITKILVRVDPDGVGGAQVLLGGIATKPVSTTYPNGVISLTFDDTNATDYTYVKQILGKYALPPVFFLIWDRLSDNGGPGPSIANYHEMMTSLGAEIGGHAYTLADHNARFENLSAAALENDLRWLRQAMLDNGFPSEAWASPGGTATPTVIQTALKYFSCHRNAGALSAFNSTQSAPPVTPRYLAGATFDATNDPLATCEAFVDKVKAAKSWGIFNLHSVSASASSGIVISNTDLDALCAYIVAAGVPVETIATVQRKVGSRY